MQGHLKRRLSTLCVTLCAANLLAGGSGLNVVVVINQNSSNSVQLGNYYSERRGVPPQNVLRIHWTGNQVVYTRAEFNTNLAASLQAMIASRQLTNQVDFIALSMDIPYCVSDTDGSTNSTTSVLYYGFKSDTAMTPPTPNSCSLPAASLNGYAGSEDLFRSTAPGSSTSNRVATMLTASNLARAKYLVDQGVNSDSTFPTQTVTLAKTTDVFRNIRYQNFDNAIFDTRLRGNYSMQRVVADPPIEILNIQGYETGMYNWAVSPNAFSPGAMADSLTSYSGGIFAAGSFTTLLEFIQAGAAGSYGTVVEPCAYLQKFPSPQNYFYQSRGFNIGECYFQSVTNPYQGLLVAEPLAAPFGLPATGVWNNAPANSLLAGTTNLSLQFTAASAQRPLQQVDLFLDGTFLQTLTNIAPRQNNILYVTLPGKTNMSYTVPGGATIKSVATGLAAVLNTPANKNATLVEAFTHGDRIELQSTDLSRSGAQTPVTVSNFISTATALTTLINTSTSNCLDTVAYGIRSCDIGGSLVVDDYLQLTVTKTNEVTVTVAITNQAAGTVASFVQQFLDAINAEPGLAGADGLVAEDFISAYANDPPFNLRARSPGWAAAQIKFEITGTFTINPAGQTNLEENLGDLRPRNHLYITAGAANLPLTFPFNTSALPDGYHELTAVAYEGSHVKTQKRVPRSILITNTTLSAVFASLVGDTNAAVETTLQFSVTANTGTISRIELFSTGGSIAVVSNQSSTMFPVAGTNLGVGLHPFYSIVTRNDGKQYRTETKWVRLVGKDAPFGINLTAPPPVITWPAAAGRSYDVLSTTNLADAFQLRQTVTPTNSAGWWLDNNSPGAQRFYRLRVSP